jgi:Glyoxalase/Bleomycin resistance protein/Dioxygenase superfamily
MSAAPSFVPYHGFLQLAYVTTDFDRALAEFGQRFGVPEWLQMRDLEIQTGPERSCRAHVALSFVGSTQLELIQPLSGDVTVYRYRLPDQGYGLCLNHIAQLIETEPEFEALEASVVSKAIPIALRGSANSGQCRYFYTDQRATLGHYVEHVWYSPEGLAFMEQIPRQ